MFPIREWILLILLCILVAIVLAGDAGLRWIGRKIKGATTGRCLRSRSPSSWSRSDYPGFWPDIP